jgi:hypothetical protein
MRKIRKAGLFLAVLLAGADAGFSQEGDPVTIPDAIRRPSRTETPRYPHDFVIGELGRGELPQEDLNYASNVLRALLQGREQSSLLQTLDTALIQECIDELRGIRADKFRIGGGKKIVDGAGSFLFRFMGRDGQLGGVMYFVKGEGGYMLDDIVLEEIPRNLLDGDKDRTPDMFLYERFY